MKLQFIEFEGNKYRLSGRYYRRNRWDQPGPSNLHRAIWESANGAIPDGHDVHHIDGDSFNNTLANLALIESRAHVRQHTLKRIAAGELLPPGEEARAEAAKWHGSEEGLAWHRVNGKPLPVRPRLLSVDAGVVCQDVCCVWCRLQNAVRQQSNILPPKLQAAGASRA